jgi:hypothetical protein
MSKVGVVTAMWLVLWIDFNPKRVLKALFEDFVEAFLMWSREKLSFAGELNSFLFQVL